MPETNCVSKLALALERTLDLDARILKPRSSKEKTASCPSSFPLPRAIDHLVFQASMHHLWPHLAALRGGSNHSRSYIRYSTGSAASLRSCSAPRQGTTRNHSVGTPGYRYFRALPSAPLIISLTSPVPRQRTAGSDPGVVATVAPRATDPEVGRASDPVRIDKIQLDLYLSGCVCNDPGVSISESGRISAEKERLHKFHSLCSVSTRQQRVNDMSVLLSRST